MSPTPIVSPPPPSNRPTALTPVPASAGSEGRLDADVMPLYLTYYFWLLLISAGVFTLERICPRRPTQEILRRGFVQDLFWMIFNTQYVSWMLAVLAVYGVSYVNRAFAGVGVPPPETARLITHWPLWLQFGAVLLWKDFLEWNIHRAMHHIPVLWRLHQLHHSIEELDWASTFRSHWGEIVVYKFLIYLPLVVLGVADGVIFAVVAVSLVVQELSHANLRWDWGPLRYLVNSPAFHAWHHDIELHKDKGQNFGISLVVWDWIFGTAHWPGKATAPARYGFEGIEQYPAGIWARFWRPFMVQRRPLNLTVSAPVPVASSDKKAARPEAQAAESDPTTNA